jgi:hypothetical protein
MPGIGEREVRGKGEGVGGFRLFGFRGVERLEVVIVLEFFLDQNELGARKDHDSLLAVAPQDVRMNRDHSHTPQLR